MVPIEISSPTFLFDFYKHNRRILHRLATIHNAADRETDGNRSPMLQHRRPKNATKSLRAISVNDKETQFKTTETVSLLHRHLSFVGQTRLHGLMEANKSIALKNMITLCNIFKGQLIPILNSPSMRSTIEVHYGVTSFRIESCFILNKLT